VVQGAGREAHATARANAEEEAVAEQVRCLKRERDAVVLAHYYVPPETQELADHVGDSFALARLARTIEAQVIVLAGVAFMGESAKLLNPRRTVLLPVPEADCPMAHMVSVEQIERVREERPGIVVVCYVNSTAEVKAASDVCVTSSNAVGIVRALPQSEVLFVPDMNLGRYVAQQVPEKHVIMGRGWCPRHAGISPESVRALVDAHPMAEVLAHPECTEEVLAEADFVGSTSQIIGRACATHARELVVLTVEGVTHELGRACAGQGKTVLFPQPAPACPNMSLVTPERVRDCLRDLSGEVALDERLAATATRPLERMLDLAERR
jgi:quinolinate synthase